MHHSFWFGKNLGAFIFPGFNITSTNGLIALCIGLACLALIYEGMKVLQITLRKRTMSVIQSGDGHSSEHLSLLSRISRRNSESDIPRTRSYWLRWILEVSHWSFHTTLSYFFMLAVMSFNGYLSIALIIGSALGYWIFGPTLIQLNIAPLLQKRQVSKCEPDCADPTTSSERRSSSVSIVAEQLMTEVNADVH